MTFYIEFIIIYSPILYTKKFIGKSLYKNFQMNLELNKFSITIIKIKIPLML